MCIHYAIEWGGWGEDKILHRIYNFQKAVRNITTLQYDDDLYFEKEMVYEKEMAYFLVSVKYEVQEIMVQF